MKRIAKIDFADGTNAYLEDPPTSNIANWIGNFYDMGDVEFVEVLEIKETIGYWSNPDCSPED